MFSPLRNRNAISLPPGHYEDTPFEDRRTVMASPDGSLYSAVLPQDMYYTKNSKQHTCTILDKLVICQRVISIMAEIDDGYPKLRVASDDGNIWHLPQKYIDGHSTFVLHDYWDSTIILISAVS